MDYISHELKYAEQWSLQWNWSAKWQREKSHEVKKISYMLFLLQFWQKI